MRGMYANLASDPSTSKIRINAVAPLWTVTGLVPKDLMEKIGVATQGPEVVARSTALLMADEERTAQVISSKRGIFREVDRAILTATMQATDAGPEDAPPDHASRKKMEELLMLAKENL